jgi:AcrR family transcriptional regulator
VTTTELSRETRGRILDTAWDRLRRDGVAGVTLKDVAADAGVSRQLLYFHFANRAGLLVALARHHDRRSGFAERVAATEPLPPVEGFEALLRAWLDYVPDLLPVARALEAALITGDVGGEAWRERMGTLRSVLRERLARIAAEKRLRPGWTADTAADWAWARIQPAGFAYLVEERGWSAPDCAERTARSVLAELVE